MLYIKFEPGEKFARKGAEIAEKPIWPDAGGILEPWMVVLDVDCLSQKQLDEFEKREGINTQTIFTDRGRHYYFRINPGFRARNGVCPWGFPIEIKTAKNTPGGICVKRNGILREIKNEGVFQDAPWWLSDRKQYPSLLGMGAGEGRNNGLFLMKQKLNGHPDTEKILRFINEVLFSEPLPESEFCQVTRDYTGGSGVDNEITAAEWIKNTHKAVWWSGSFWVWDGIKYVEDQDEDIINKLLLQCAPGRRSAFYEEAKAQLKIRCKKIKDDIHGPFVVRFQNGFLENGEFVELPDYSEFTPYYVGIPYDPEAEPVPEVDNYLDTLTNKDPAYRDLLLEKFGFVFETNPIKVRAYGGFTIMVGPGGNGKSTFFDVMQSIYNRYNCSYLSIRQLAQEKYQTALLGKLANLGDDLEPEAISNEQLKALKNITTADSVEARRLYGKPFIATFTAKLFFTSNTAVKSFEKGFAFQRRILWLPMPTTIEKPDPDFKSKLTTEKALKYWVKLLVAGYMRLYKNGKFTECDYVKEFNRQYHLDNNYMARFLTEIDYDLQLLGKTREEVEMVFKAWNDDPRRPFNGNQLRELLKAEGIALGRKRIGESVEYRYMRQSETTQKII